MTTIEKIRHELEEYLRVLALKHIGFLIVAEWEEGGSDAINFDPMTLEEFFEEFDEAPKEDAKAFWEGKRESFILRHWTDEHGRRIKDTIWHMLHYGPDDNEMHIEDEKEVLTIHFNKEKLKDIKPPIEVRIQTMSKRELEKLLTGLNYTLSGSEIGERDAFKLLAEIESLAIEAKKTATNPMTVEEAQALVKPPTEEELQALEEQYGITINRNNL